MESLKNYYYNYKYQILFIFVLIVASFLRLYDLGGKSLWIDEGFTLYQVQHSLPELTSILKNDVHPPLYFYLEHFYIKIFGTSEFSLRFISAIFGIIIILFCWKFLLKNFNKNISLIGCILISFSTIQIRYSQEARAYTLFTLLTLISFYYFISLLKEGNLKNSSIYILSSTLMLYTHNYAFLYLGVQIVFLIYLSIKNKTIIIKEFFPIIIIILLFIPWLSTYLNQVSSIQNGFWIKTPTLKNIAGIWNSFSSNIIASFILNEFFLITVISLLKREKQLQKFDEYDLRVILILWATLPLLIAYVISLVFVPITQSRYIIPSSIPFFILAAYSISKLNIKYKYGFIILLLGLLFMGIYSYFTYQKEDWRNAVKIVEKNIKGGEKIYLADITDKLFNFYSKHKYSTNKESLKNVVNKSNCWYVVRDAELDSDSTNAKIIEHVALKKYKLPELTIYYLD